MLACDMLPLLCINSIPRRMITGHETRLGRGGAEEIKNHAFFAGVDWTTIRNIESPFIPQLRYVAFQAGFCL